jgi:hypothetical protein
MSAPCCPFAAAAAWITAVLGIAGLVLALWFFRSDGSNPTPNPGQEVAKPAVVSEN